MDDVPGVDRVKNLEIGNSRNKSHAKISEITVFHILCCHAKISEITVFHIVCCHAKISEITVFHILCCRKCLTATTSAIQTSSEQQRRDIGILYKNYG